jgi:glycosyltransferase involved in cell wall biosynthesis
VADAPASAEVTGRLAVVIPFHHADRWFPEALASVLTQTRPPDEIVVVDDATPAGEARTLENLPDRVRVIRLARNAGASTARQIGTEATHADLVAYLDADDWWEPRFLEDLEETLTRHPGAPASYSAIVKRYPDGRQTPFRAKPAMLDIREAIVRSHLLPSGFVVRRAALDSIGGWRRDRMVVEDWDLSVRLLDRCGPIPLVPELLVNYRVGNPASLNAQHWNTLRRWRHTLALNRQLVEKHFGRGAARRRWAQAFADRRDRAGGFRGRCYGVAARVLGPPLREALPE